MKWDRWIAALFIMGGVAYASFSLISYLSKLGVENNVATISPSNTVQNSASVKSNPGEPWIIYPKIDRPKQGEHFANLYIPRLKVEIPIIEGTHEDELAQGVGHYAGSVLPGEPDNAVLSGHRDTVFRKMGMLKKGDQLHVRTKYGTFVYVIRKMWITDSEDRTVIVPRDKPILTLTTCYPFSYIGPAPDRYIIEATLQERVIS